MTPCQQGRMALRSPDRGAHSVTAPRVHRFAESLALSDQFTDADWWLPIYRRAFPRLASAVSVRQDGWAQRGGIDRVLTLECGRIFTIDQKVRMENWPDVLLEQWSDEGRRVPGWIQKPLACDFIAYAYGADDRRAAYRPRGGRCGVRGGRGEASLSGGAGVRL